MFKKFSRNIVFALLVAVMLLVIYKEYNIKEGFGGGWGPWLLVLGIISVVWIILMVSFSLYSFDKNSTITRSTINRAT